MPVKLPLATISDKIAHYEFDFDISNGKLVGSDLQVHEKGKGYGRELARAKEDFLRRLGFKEAVVCNPNPHAIGFWEKMGYKLNEKGVYVKPL